MPKPYSLSGWALDQMAGGLALCPANSKRAAGDRSEERATEAGSGGKISARPTNFMHAGAQRPRSDGRASALGGPWAPREVNIAVDQALAISEAPGMAKHTHQQLRGNWPPLSAGTVHVDPFDESGERHPEITEDVLGSVPGSVY